jgi:hypothetical protein
MSPEHTLYDGRIGSADFHIEIVKQGWIASDDPDYDVAARDLCTHGDIRLTIGGEIIAVGDGEGQYGISEAALGLLRTLESDRPDASGQPFADRLVPHGCGAILMMGCGIGIDWTVMHVEGRVRIAEVVRYDSTAEDEGVRFPGLVVEVPLAGYRDEIKAFAQRAKEPFEGIAKSFDDDVDRQDYFNFWEEYERLLNQTPSA